MGHDWGTPDSERIWNEMRKVSPMHGGMSYKRVEELGGIQWPCYDESHPGEMYLHGRLWSDPLIGPRAPFSAVEFDPPVDRLDENFPIRLTTGRRLDSYNSGVQSERFSSPLRHEESLDLSREAGRLYQLKDGATVRITSRQGSAIRALGLHPGRRPGLACLPPH